MNDTPSYVERQMTELFMRRPAGARIRAACEMFDFARQVLIAGIQAEHPGVALEELRVRIFERTYGPDFNAADTSALRRVCALPAAWKTREQTTIADQYPYYGQPAEAPEK